MMIYLTPAQAAETLEMSGSSLRRIRQVFSDYLISESASHPGRGRRHSYTYEDIVILSKIKTAYRSGKSDDEIKASLVNQNEKRSPSQALARLPEIYSVRIDDVISDNAPEDKGANRKIRFSTLARGHVLYEIKQGFTQDKYIPMTFDQWKDTLLFFDCVCAYCGSRAEIFEHFIPARKGGRFVYGNIIPACNRCNTKKGYRDPYEWMGLNCRAEDISRIVEFVSASLFVITGGRSLANLHLHADRLSDDSHEAPGQLDYN